MPPSTPHITNFLDTKLCDCASSLSDETKLSTTLCNVICIIFEVWSHNPVGSQTSINYQTISIGMCCMCMTIISINVCSFVAQISLLSNPPPLGPTTLKDAHPCHPAALKGWGSRRSWGLGLSLKYVSSVSWGKKSSLFVERAART